MDPRRLLFTRQQIGDLVGLDDTALNYWMRERVLIPAEGGGGKGQHRRFTWHEVNLAAILKEIRDISGASVSNLKELADLFHEAICWVVERGLTDLDLYLVHAVKHDYAIFAKQGYVSVAADQTPRPEGEQVIAGRIRQNWQQHWNLMLSMKDYAGLTHRHMQLAQELDDEEFESNSDRYALIAQIPDDPESPIYSTMFFRRDGQWVIQSLLKHSSDPDPPTSFIGH